MLCSSLALLFILKLFKPKVYAQKKQINYEQFGKRENFKIQRVK